MNDIINLHCKLNPFFVSNAHDWYDNENSLCECQYLVICIFRASYLQIDVP